MTDYWPRHMWVDLQLSEECYWVLTLLLWGQRRVEALFTYGAACGPWNEADFCEIQVRWLRSLEDGTFQNKLGMKAADINPSVRSPVSQPGHCGVWDNHQSLSIPCPYSETGLYSWEVLGNNVIPMACAKIKGKFTKYLKHWTLTSSLEKLFRGLDLFLSCPDAFLFPLRGQPGKGVRLWPCPKEICTSNHQVPGSSHINSEK